MGTQEEAAAQLAEASASLAKISAETTKLLEKVTELEAAAENSKNVTPELQAAVDAVVAQAKAVDEQVPDAA